MTAQLNSGGPEGHAGRVVVAVSLGLASAAALDWAISWSVARSMALVVCAVHPPQRYEDDVRDVEHQAILDSARERIEDVAPSLTASFVLLRGELVHALDDISSTSDLLVIGGRSAVHGTEGRADAILSLKLAGRITVPLVVVPEGWTPRAGRVVVGIDEPSDGEAVAFAAAEAESADAELLLVRAVKLAPRSAAEPHAHDDLAARAFEAARALAQKRYDSLRGERPGLRVETHVAVGDTSRTLARAATGSALVVVGTSHRIAFASLFRGSPGHDLLVDLPCPVAVVPQRPADPVGNPYVVTPLR